MCILQYKTEKYWIQCSKQAQRISDVSNTKESERAECGVSETGEDRYGKPAKYDGGGAVGAKNEKKSEMRNKKSWKRLW